MAEDWDIERVIQDIKRRKQCNSGNLDPVIDNELNFDFDDETEEYLDASEDVEGEMSDGSLKGDPPQLSEHQQELNIIWPTASKAQTIQLVQADGQVLQTITNAHIIIPQEQINQEIIQLQTQQKSIEETQISENSEPRPSSPLMEPLFYIGKDFSSYRDICIAKKMYEQQNKINLPKRKATTLKSYFISGCRKDTNYNQELIYAEIIYHCMFSGEYKPHRSGGKSFELDKTAGRNISNVKKKRKSSTCKLQCPFELKLTLSKDGQTLRVSKFQEEHNHICHSLIYNQLPQQRRLDAEHLEETKMLLELNVDKKKIQQYLYSKGKMVTIKDLHNLMKNVKLEKNKVEKDSYTKEKMVKMKDLQNLMINEDKGSNSFEDVLALMMNHQDISFELMIANESVCRGIFLQTEAMKSTFDTSSDMIFVDTTYKLNEHRMPLYVILCVDSNGESSVIALALAQYENKETLSWIAESFKKYNPNFMKIKYIMAEKDMPERQELINHFPNSQLLNCQLFQTIQTLKKEVTRAKMDISEEERDFSLEIIQNTVFARDKDTCDSNITLLKEMAPQEVVDYFTKNWEPIKDDWARGLQSQLTNEREDIFNGRLKSVIKSYSTMTQFFTELLTVIRNYEWKRNQQAINNLIKRPTDMVQENMPAPYVSNILKDQKESTLTLPTGQVFTFSPFLSSSPESHLMEPMFYVGQEFTSYEDICEAKELYEKQNKICLVKRTSRRIINDFRRTSIKVANQELVYSELGYSCLHSGEYRGGKVAKKRKTSTYKLKCPFRMDLYLSKDGQTLELVKLQEEHNHICHSSIYEQLPQQRRLDAETLEETKMLLALNVDKNKIQQHLHSQGNMVTLRDLYNLERSVLKKSHSFDDVLALIENDLDLSFEELRNSKNVCNGIFFQTEAMKLNFDAYCNSETIFFDTTYKLDEDSMSLYVILCLDENGESTVIALALVLFENKETLSWIAESFIKHNPNFMKVKYIMADKDMLGKQVLLKHFPNAQLSTHLFLLRTIEKEVTTTKMDISTEERNFSLEMIQNIVFAEDKATSDSNISLLKETAREEVVDCFTKNWEPIRDDYDWDSGLQNQFVDFYPSINKREEKFNNELKSLLESYSSLAQFFTDLMTILRQYEGETMSVEDFVGKEVL